MGYAYHRGIYLGGYSRYITSSFFEDETSTNFYRLLTGVACEDENAHFSGTPGFISLLYLLEGFLGLLFVFSQF